MGFEIRYGPDARLLGGVGFQTGRDAYLRAREDEERERAAQQAAQQRQIAAQAAMQERSLSAQAAERGQERGMRQQQAARDDFWRGQGMMADLYKQQTGIVGDVVKQQLGFMGRGQERMQDFQLGQMGADAAQKRAQENFDYEFSQRDKRRLADRNEAISRVREMMGEYGPAEGGTISREQGMDLIRQIELGAAGIKPQQMPKSKPYSQQVEEDVVTMRDGTRVFPKGKYDIVPPQRQAATRQERPVDLSPHVTAAIRAARGPDNPVTGEKGQIDEDKYNEHLGQIIAAKPQYRGLLKKFTKNEGYIKTTKGEHGETLNTGAVRQVVDWKGLVNHVLSGDEMEDHPGADAVTPPPAQDASGQILPRPLGRPGPPPSPDDYRGIPGARAMPARGPGPPPSPASPDDVEQPGRTSDPQAAMFRDPQAKEWYRGQLLKQFQGEPDQVKEAAESVFELQFKYPTIEAMPLAKLELYADRLATIAMGHTEDQVKGKMRRLEAKVREQIGRLKAGGRPAMQPKPAAGPGPAAPALVDVAFN